MAKSPFEKPMGTRNEVWLGPKVVGERIKPKSPAETLVARRAALFESVTPPIIRDTGNAQVLDTGVQMKPEAFIAMRAEGERQAIEAHRRAAVLRAGLEAVEQGQKPAAEFRTEVESLLADAAKRLRETKDPFLKEAAQEELAAYQEYLDRIDTIG